MNTKLVSLLVFVAITIALVVIFALYLYQRKDNDVLAEIVIWPYGGGERGVPIHRFIVKNDGILVFYQGLSRSDSSRHRTRNFIRTVQERREIVLNDGQFLRISELVEKVVSGESEISVWGSIFVVFLYNGRIYESNTVWSKAMLDLFSVLHDLTNEMRGHPCQNN